MSTFIDDRRSTKRYDILLKLNYSDPTTNCQGECLTKNISRDGIRFPLNIKIEKGSLLDLIIENPYKNTFIHSKAEVMWAEKLVNENGYELGVKLLKKRLY